MASTRVFSGTAQTNQINRTDSLENAVAIYVLPPDIVDELEIDFYLQLEISANRNQRIRIDPNNFANSLLVYEIPLQYQNTGLNIYGAFLSSFNVSLEIWGIFADVSLNTINEKLDQLVEEVNDNEGKIDLNNALQIGDLTNELAQNTALGLLAGSLTPITAGVSATAIPSLTGGSAIITPLLSAGTGIL